jgi:hypothetical protein
MSMLAKKISSFVLAVAFLAGGFFVVREANTSRQLLGLVRQELPAQARPDLLTNVLFSVGRALAVDYLWIGLQKMQEEGRYFDANQRSEWICQLQPNFTSVWIFQAWNMSYNISVAMTTGADRWRWVRNGYELLRDRGIPLNPKSISLYQQLAWIFHHKIGAMSDDWHWYYKIQIARAMEDIIGWPEPRYDLMARAPTSWEALVSDPKTAAFVQKLRDFGVDPREKFLYLLTHRNEYGDKVLALIDDPANKASKDLLEGFIRAQRLAREWKMDARVVAELRRDDQYGPLDFRTPQAHAIYWSYMGSKRTGGDTSFDALNTDRVVYGSLQDLVRRGRFLITADELPLFAPDLRFAWTLHRVYLSLGKKWAQAEKRPWDGTAGENFRDGHINYLRKIVAVAYQYGREDLSEKFWKELNTLYPNPEYKIGRMGCIRKFVREDIGSKGMVDVNVFIKGYLIQSFLNYAWDDDYQAVALRRYARTMYESYQDDRIAKSSETGRMRLEPWKDCVDFAEKVALQNLPERFQERLRTKLHRPPPGIAVPEQ